MLCLSRKPGETIVIDGVTEVTVVSIRGDKVRLGIVAPKEVSVNRKEIEIQIRADQRNAAPNQLAANAAE